MAEEIRQCKSMTRVRQYSYAAIIIIWTFSGIFFFSDLQGQCASGGDNIFLEGDFGSGTSNVITSDPGLAPGYRYVLTVPPDDGEYVITNDMSQWPNLWPTWLDIGDNSSDPNGYMMVVNASFTAGIFFKEVVSGLCEQTTYNFSADMINLITTPTQNHILPNVSFFIDGLQVFATGDIQQDETWHTYEFSFETLVGQTFVDLSLRNNAPGGFGNDVGLDNISFRPCGPDIFIQAVTLGPLCEGLNSFKVFPIVRQDPNVGLYQWQESFDNGMTWSDIVGAQHNDTLTFNNLATSTYMYRLIYATSQAGLSNDKCLTPSNEVTVFVPPLNYFLVDTICEGTSLPFNGRDLTSSGSYQANLVSSLNCDSIVHLDLTVVDDSNISAIIDSLSPSCAGESDGLIDIISIDNGYQPLKIFLDGDTISLDRFPIEVAAGTYDIQIMDRLGCTWEETIDIIDPLPFIVQNVHDTLIYFGDFISIIPTSNYPSMTSTWVSDGNILCQACPELDIMPFESTMISGIFTNQNNCTVELPFTVRVVLLRPIFIPDVFTPANGDDINDRFTIFSPRHLIEEVVSLQIFNRWGGLVFQKLNFPPNDESYGWDGNIHDQEPTPGVYVYVYKVRYIDNVEIGGSGSVTILK